MQKVKSKTINNQIRSKGNYKGSDAFLLVKNISDCCKNIFQHVFSFLYESKLIIIGHVIITTVLNESEAIGL